jgi:eukaryotic-like serine/threonine-protein kinase
VPDREDSSPPAPPASAHLDSPRLDEGETLARPPGQAATPGARETPGDRIGQYKLLQQLGEGGFGRVYLADQQEPVKRRVAVKVLKRGMASEQVIARFEAERQALALMDHPGIAKVLDAGTTPQDTPYFVMELVRGVAITDYCDRHRMATEERLSLFVRVCHAVQHAHQKGVIHRDLKPGNVLVTEVDDRPVPKVIDFGIAKAISGRLTGSSAFTDLRHWVGTPAYMSPEQMAGGGIDVDTRTDVYSLGVLLYQLLTGVTPIDAQRLENADPLDILRIVREEEPLTPSIRISRLGGGADEIAHQRRAEPSALRRALRGDLDWITMKALAKDRAQRYDTASALALDIERHLRHEPVLAGPPSARYRLGKLVRRHRLAFAAGGTVAVALVAGVLGTTWGLLRASREAEEARRQAAIARSVNDFLNIDLLAAVAPSSQPGQGREVTMREVLEVAAERIDEQSRTGGRFAEQPLVEAAIRRSLGSSYMALGEYPAAEVHYARALELNRAELGANSIEAALAQGSLGLLHWRQGRLGEAAAGMEESLATLRERLGEEHAETVQATLNLATVFKWQARFGESEELFRRALDTATRTEGADSRSAVDVLGNLANLLQETGRYEEAEALHRRELAVRRRIDGEREPTTLGAMNNLANDLALLGRLGEAEPLMRETYELKIELYGAQHPSTLNSLSNLGEVSYRMDRSEEAERHHREVLALRRAALGELHPRTLYSLGRLALALEDLDRFEEAEGFARKAALGCVETLGEQHPSCIEAHGIRAATLLGLDRPREALEILQRQLALVEERTASSDESEDLAPLAATSRFQLGRALAALGRREEAELQLTRGAEGLPAHEAPTRRAYAEIVRFYAEWNAADPGGGHGARGEPWRQRLEGL